LGGSFFGGFYTEDTEKTEGTEKRVLLATEITEETESTEKRVLLATEITEETENTEKDKGM